MGKKKESDFSKEVSDKCRAGMRSFKDSDGVPVICITPNKNDYYSNTNDYPNNDRDNDKDYGSYSGSQYGGEEKYGPGAKERYEAYIGNSVNSSNPFETIIGGASDSSRKYKGDYGVNYRLIKPIQRMHREKVVGNEYLKGMVFRDCDLTGDDMDYIMNMPDWVDYNFKIIDFSNNLGINDLGIQYALRGNCSHDDGNKYKGFLGRDRLHVVKLDLSNCNISDNGAGLIAEALSDGKLASTKCINLAGNNITDKGTVTIAEALKTGKFPTLKRLDVSGNDTSLVTEKFMLDALKHPSTQSVILLLKRSDDLKVVLSGSKEEKQKLIKTTLQTAQDNGVDVKNVAVSKNITDKITNFAKVGYHFIIGFGKCNIVPEDTETFAIERITAKICKKTAGANAAKDAVVCFFDTIEDIANTPEGVQFIKDFDLLGANSVIDSIE